MIKKNLSEWLDWIKTLHFKEIDLGLARVFEVARRLRLLNPSFTIVTVGGTNGKGSCVAGLSAIYRAAGHRVGAYTSPFLFRYNEQVCVDGQMASDETLCDAFAKVYAACHPVTLTSFEFSTLAAMFIFEASNLDMVILEVGLGGRYDAVNIWDADVALITSIALDHMDWLGQTRDAIAYQKAGIFRVNKPAVCGDYNPPASLLNEKVKKLYRHGIHFGFEQKKNEWSWWDENNHLDNLPCPALALQNMSTVLMAVAVLQEKHPVSDSAIIEGLKNVQLAGRIQVVPGIVPVIYDVAHNPASAKWLADYLERNPLQGKTIAVFSMLADKDIVSTLNVIKTQMDSWNIAPLSVTRGSSSDFLLECFNKANVFNVTVHESIENACYFARDTATKGDRIVVFGSFHTVASAAATLNVRACVSTL